MSYRKYAQEALDKALLAVRSNTLSQRAAAKAYSIPRSTLADRITGRVPDIATSGPDPILTVAEEKELVQYIIGMCQIGYPLTKRHLLVEVKRLMDFDALPVLLLAVVFVSDSVLNCFSFGYGTFR